jgi:hypothetical protein
VIETTDAEVLALAKKITDERPDYVYKAPEWEPEKLHGYAPESFTNCFYVHPREDGKGLQPGCVVGELLHRLGVPLETLAKREGIGAWTLVPETVTGLSHSVRFFLGKIQNFQDEGHSWGEAYKAAYERYERERAYEEPPQ